MSELMIFKTLIALFFLTSCTGKNFIIKNADQIIEMQVTKRLPLDKDQESELEKDIDVFLNHNKSKAILIIPFIENFKGQDVKELESLYSNLEKYYSEIFDDFSEILAKHLTKLNIEQQKELFDTLETENNELLKLKKSKRFEQIEDRFKFYAGTINNDQKKILQTFEEYFEKRHKDRIQRRLEIQKSLKNIYQLNINQAERVRLINESFKKYQIEGIKDNKNLELLKLIFPTLTEEQKKHFLNNLGEVKNILTFYISVQY